MKKIMLAIMSILFAATVSSVVYADGGCGCSGCPDAQAEQGTTDDSNGGSDTTEQEATPEAVPAA
jgi:hypothetical protein